MTNLRLNVTVVAIVLVLTSAFVFGLFMPGMGRLREARAELAEKVAKVKTDQQQVGDVSDLYASILHMDEKTRDFRKRLPAERQFGEFLNDLSDNLETSGIEDYSVQPRSAQVLDQAKLPASLKLAEGTILLPVVVSFESDFDDLFKFLRGVESLPRLSHVEMLKLVNDEERPGRVAVEVTLCTYHHPH